MRDPRTAPYGSVRLAGVDTLAQVDPGNPALRRAARATADDTTIFMVGGPTGVPYTISRWEAALP